jgi:two-component system response regulator PilR (NtrC family)
MRYKIERYKIEDKPSEPETSHMEVFKIESLSDFIKSVEIETITEALKLTETNKTEAAELLGISFRSLRYRIEQLGIKN